MTPSTYRLILMRHAKAEPDCPSGKDQDRPLSQRGLAQCSVQRARARHWMNGGGIALVSTSTRTRQTWENLSLENFARRDLNELYLASAREISTAAQAHFQEWRTVLVIGHNPGLRDFAQRLNPPPTTSSDVSMPSFDRFQTAQIAVFDSSEPSFATQTSMIWSGGSGI